MPERSASPSSSPARGTVRPFNAVISSSSLRMGTTALSSDELNSTTRASSASGSFGADVRLRLSVSVDFSFDVRELSFFDDDYRQ